MGPFATSGPSTSAAARIVVQKAASTVIAKVQPTKVKAKRTKATVAIAVTAPGVAPTRQGAGQGRREGEEVGKVRVAPGRRG